MNRYRKTHIFHFLKKKNKMFGCGKNKRICRDLYTTCNFIVYRSLVYEGNSGQHAFFLNDLENLYMYLDNLIDK